MGKISQDDARSAAQTICEPINVKAVEIESKLREYITELYKQSIPADVMKMFEKNPEYIKTTSSVKISGQGLVKDRSVSFIGSFPSNKGEYYVTLHMTNEQAKKAVKLVEQRQEMEEKYKNTKDEIETTILNLGTHKRVLDDFPEAYGSLPGVNINTQMTVQLQPVRDKVKCLISEDIEKKCISKL